MGTQRELKSLTVTSSVDRWWGSGKVNTKMHAEGEINQKSTAWERPGRGKGKSYTWDKKKKGENQLPHFPEVKEIKDGERI